MIGRPAERDEDFLYFSLAERAECLKWLLRRFVRSLDRRVFRDDNLSE